MAENKLNLYEMLGVSPAASLAELKAAHRRLSFETMSGKLDLSREDCDHRLKLLDVALSTLSDPSLRDVYDIGLAAANPEHTALPAKPASELAVWEGQALQLATAVGDMYKTDAMTVDERQVQFGVVSQAVGTSMKSLKIILKIALWLFLLAWVVRMGGCVLAARKAVPPPSAVAKAEEKLIIQEYYKQHGVRAANRAEVAALAAEDKRRENERSKEEFNQQKADDELQRFFKEASAKNAREEQEKARAEAEARYEAAMRQREGESPRGSNED